MQLLGGVLDFSVFLLFRVAVVGLEIYESWEEETCSSSPKCFTAFVCAFCAPWLAILLCKDLRTETNILQVENDLQFQFQIHRA